MYIRLLHLSDARRALNATHRRVRRRAAGCYVVTRDGEVEA